DPKELRIEAVDLLQEAALAGVELARGVGVRVVVIVHVPAVGGNVPDDTLFGQEQPPECGGAIGASPGPATHADDGNRFVHVTEDGSHRSDPSRKKPNR